MSTLFDYLSNLKIQTYLTKWYVLQEKFQAS